MRVKVSYKFRGGNKKRGGGVAAAALPKARKHIKQTPLLNILEARKLPWGTAFVRCKNKIIAKTAATIPYLKYNSFSYGFNFFITRRERRKTTAQKTCRDPPRRCLLILWGVGACVSKEEGRRSKEMDLCAIKCQAHCEIQRRTTMTFPTFADH